MFMAEIMRPAPAQINSQNDIDSCYQNDSIQNMSKRNYWNKLSAEEREQLAKAAGTTVGYLKLIVYEVRDPSPKLANKIHQVTGGDWPREILRPDIYSSAPV